MKFLNVSYKILIILCYWCIVQDTNAQTPKFYLQTDRTTVSEGETFLLEAVLENIDAKNIIIPDVSPFKIVQGPSTSTSISIINGKRSGTISNQYILLAPKKGKYKIAPATTNVGSKVIKSNALSIEVVGESSSKSIKSTGGEETFVRLEVSDEQVFIGQQVSLNYVMYTRQNIASYNFLNEPNLEGFYSQPINDIRDQPQRKTINGKEYYVQVIRRQMLFPQKTGNYEIGPINTSLEVPVENGRSSFFFRETRKENIKSNILKLVVKDLPEPIPSSFSGAVGNFEMKSTLQKSTVSKGEAISIQMTVEGDGDPKIIKAPEFPLPIGLEKYEPSTTKDESTVQGDRIKTQKVFEYIFVPLKDTIYNLQPSFTYLSSETGLYQTIKSAPFTINVTKGSTSNPVPAAPTVDVKSQISTDTSLYSLKESPWGSFWHVGSVCLIALITAGGIYIKKRKQENELVRHQNMAKAGSIAKQHLQKALVFKNQQDAKSFYEEIANATTGYILQKYKIPNIESSSEEITSHLGQHQVSNTIIEKYTHIQKKCELARFAAQYNDMENIYADAEWLIDQMEKGYEI